MFLPSSTPSTHTPPASLSAPSPWLLTWKAAPPGTSQGWMPRLSSRNQRTIAQQSLDWPTPPPCATPGEQQSSPSSWKQPTPPSAHTASLTVRRPPTQPACHPPRSGDATQGTSTSTPSATWTTRWTWSWPLGNKMWLKSIEILGRSQCLAMWPTPPRRSSVPGSDMKRTKSWRWSFRWRCFITNKYFANFIQTLPVLQESSTYDAVDNDIALLNVYFGESTAMGKKGYNFFFSFCRVWAKPEEDHHRNLGWHGCLVRWELKIAFLVIDKNS